MPGGRPKGAKNKTTVERELRAATGVRAALEDGALPLDVILRVMRGDQAVTPLQFEAAQAAAPYVHARLASTTVTHKDAFSEMTVEQLRTLLALAERLALGAGGANPGGADAARAGE